MAIIRTPSGARIDTGFLKEGVTRAGGVTVTIGSGGQVRGTTTDVGRTSIEGHVTRDVYIEQKPTYDVATDTYKQQESQRQAQAQTQARQQAQQQEMRQIAASELQSRQETGRGVVPPSYLTRQYQEQQRQKDVLERIPERPNVMTALKSPSEVGRPELTGRRYVGGKWVDYKYKETRPDVERLIEKAQGLPEPLKTGSKFALGGVKGTYETIGYVGKHPVTTAVGVGAVSLATMTPIGAGVVGTLAVGATAKQIYEGKFPYTAQDIGSFGAKTALFAGAVGATQAGIRSMLPKPQASIQFESVIRQQTKDIARSQSAVYEKAVKIEQNMVRTKTEHFLKQTQKEGNLLSPRGEPARTVLTVKGGQIPTGGKDWLGMPKMEKVGKGTFTQIGEKVYGTFPVGKYKQVSIDITPKETLTRIADIRTGKTISQFKQPTLETPSFVPKTEPIKYSVGGQAIKSRGETWYKQQTGKYGEYVSRQNKNVINIQEKLQMEISQQTLAISKPYSQVTVGKREVTDKGFVDFITKEQKKFGKLPKIEYVQSESKLVPEIRTRYVQEGKNILRESIPASLRQSIMTKTSGKISGEIKYNVKDTPKVVSKQDVRLDLAQASLDRVKPKSEPILDYLKRQSIQQKQSIAKESKISKDSIVESAQRAIGKLKERVVKVQIKPIEQTLKQSAQTMKSIQSLSTLPPARTVQQFPTIIPMFKPSEKVPTTQRPTQVRPELTISSVSSKDIVRPIPSEIQYPKERLRPSVTEIQIPRLKTPQITPTGLGEVQLPKPDFPQVQLPKVVPEIAVPQIPQLKFPKLREPTFPRIPTPHIIEPPYVPSGGGYIPAGSKFRFATPKYMKPQKKGYIPSLIGLAQPKALKKLPKNYLSTGSEIRFKVKLPKGSPLLRF